MATANFPHQIVELLTDATAEIAKFDNHDNAVSRRLIAFQQRQSETSLTATVGELANCIDVSPREMLDALLAVGVQTFWHEGARFRTPSSLRSYLSSAPHINPVPDLEFDLTPNQLARLAAEMGVDDKQLITDAAPLKPISHVEEGFEMTTEASGSDIEKLLMDAAAEIAALDGTQNEVFRRLMTELQNQAHAVRGSEQHSVTSPTCADKPLRKFSPSESIAPARAAIDKKQTGS